MAARCHGGAGNGPTPTATPLSPFDERLGALLGDRIGLVDKIERCAVEAVRAWMIAHDRPLLAVDISRSLPDYTRDADEALSAAVGNMPPRVFRWGLDNRGEYIVRLSDLNDYLGRAPDDRTPAELAVERSRLELVVIRDPDGGTDTTLYLDGQELSDSDYEEYVIDAGYGHDYEDWIDSRDGAIASASPAAAEQLRQAYDDPPGYKYIEGAPDGWPGR